jgi:hypothetical protein
MRDYEFDSVYVVVMASPGETRVFRVHYGVPSAPTPARNGSNS